MLATCGYIKITVFCEKCFIQNWLAHSLALAHNLDLVHSLAIARSLALVHSLACHSKRGVGITNFFI